MTISNIDNHFYIVLAITYESNDSNFLSLAYESIISEAAPCDELGRFGWKCRFSCNCADGADCERQTGYCQNGCKPGFYGWGCQFGMFP
ncbi:hypothetical protein DPMN_177136 [Dreissena polymorpha]|uniref:Uncharacterized protein n=1 Tax=Dreissena polymorpha TaxID=45954 RepID=A0A9D4IHK5_DREPO|nr:hypothetical protein DPMN_177136 [Dreissena polymorpha]